MRILAIMAGVCGLAACAAVPPTPEEAADRCEARAQAAQAPTGAVSVGANSQTGMSTGISIGLSGDFLRGRDPQEVYESCVIDLTGEPPIRPARLRSL
jgi:hypothetical protein